MVLNRLGGEIDITQLSIETPRQMPSSLWGEIERVLTPERQNKLFAQVRARRERIHTESTPYFNAAANLKLLFPERAAELKLDIEAWKILKEKAQESTSSESVIDSNSIQGPPDLDAPPTFSLHSLMTAKILYPDRYAEFGIDKEKEDEIIGKIRDAYKHWNTPLINSFIYSYRAKVLFPHRFHEVSSDAPSLLSWQKLIEQEKINGNWMDFARYAAYFKIVFPEKIDELEIGDFEWSHMLQTLKDSNLTADSLFPWNLKMLAAEKIVPSSNGIDIIMPTRPEEAEMEQTMPTERNF
jgi:hypothetical protein